MLAGRLLDELHVANGEGVSEEHTTHADSRLDGSQSLDDAAVRQKFLSRTA